MNISVVIPNYNGEKIIEKNISQTLKVLEKYSDSQKHTIEVVIVDDGSTDSSKQIIQSLFNDHTSSIGIRLLFNNRNYGFSTTVNKGVAAAKGEIVILLNTDVIPEKDFLDSLLPHFADEKVFGVGCLDKSIENGETVYRGRGIGQWKNGLLHHNKGENTTSTTLWVAGGSGAFRKSIWEKLGGLSEILNPFYWEDVDLGYRALKAGYNLVFEKNSVVTHMHEEGSIKSTQTTKRVTTIAYRNQHLFTILNATDAAVLQAYFLNIPRFLAGGLFSNGYERGFIYMLFLLPKALQLRARNKKLFTKTDEEICKQFASEL